MIGANINQYTKNSGNPPPKISLKLGLNCPEKLLTIEKK